MSFMQQTVYLQQGFGVPGELFNDGPVRAQSLRLDSASAAYNIIGSTCYTVKAQGSAQAGSGGAYGFAGFLVNPKTQALRGDGTDPLNPSLTLPNQVQGELLTMGTIVVMLPAAANIGDLVIFDNTTGAISTIAPGDDLPSGKSFAYAMVDYFQQSVSGAGLAVVTVSPTLTIPQPA